MVTRKAEMLKTVNARTRKIIKIKVGDKEGLLQSYVVNLIETNV